MLLAAQFLVDHTRVSHAEDPVWGGVVEVNVGDCGGVVSGVEDHGWLWVAAEWEVSLDEDAVVVDATVSCCLERVECCVLCAACDGVFGEHVFDVVGDEDDVACFAWFDGCCCLGVACCVGDGFFWG